MRFFKIGRRETLAALLAVVLITGFYPALSVGAPESKPAVSAAPDFELEDINGTNVTLSQFKGKKPVLLYFWATWCQYCMSARPSVIKLRKDIPQGDLEILGVNVGGGDSLAKVKRFEEAHPANFTVLFDGDNKAVRAFQVQGIPLFVLIDKDGNVKYRGNEMPSNPLQILKKQG